jgi:hypothetical protein
MGRKLVLAVFVAILSAVVATTLAFGASNRSASIGWGSRSSRPTAPNLQAASGRLITEARTIRTVLRIGVFKTFDVGPNGVSVGDSYVFGGPLFDRTNTHRVGFLSGECVYTNPGFHSLSTCHVTATPHEEGPSLAFGDQITLQGWNDDTPFPFKAAVNGGTGMFRNVRGDMLAIPGDPFRIIFRLIP